MTILAVYTTVGSLEAARAMAKSLVERRLAACAQIMPIESVYRWQGAVRDDPEYRIVFKIGAARYADVQSAIRALHDYELPAIHAVPLEHVYEPYAQWVEAESS